MGNCPGYFPQQHSGLHVFVFRWWSPLIHLHFTLIFSRKGEKKKKREREKAKQNEQTWPGSFNLGGKRRERGEIKRCLLRSGTAVGATSEVTGSGAGVPPVPRAKTKGKKKKRVFNSQPPPYTAANSTTRYWGTCKICGYTRAKFILAITCESIVDCQTFTFYLIKVYLFT